MHIKTSKLAAVRKVGATQVEAQRASILDAAERCFLRSGLEHTSMADIAEEAGVTRVTLYRYFSDRDPIAFEIAGRMLQRIGSAHTSDIARNVVGEGRVLELLKGAALAMIGNFGDLRDVYRYLGMFDQLYSDRYPTDELATWYKQQLESLRVGGVADSLFALKISHAGHALMAMNATMSFLKQMAARGDLMAAEQGLQVREQLELFGEMIGTYFDSLIVSLPQAKRRKRNS